MDKTTTYIDLSLLSEDQLKQIPVLCDEFSVHIFTQYRNDLEEGRFNEKFPFFLFVKQFNQYTCTPVRHYEKTEIEFSQLRDTLSEAEIPIELTLTEQKVSRILDILNENDLSYDQKLQILSTTRKRLEKVK